MQVAAGIDGKIEPFPAAFGFFRQDSGAGPSIIITSQPNPDQTVEFTPLELAIWETDGALHDLSRYHFEHTRINDRDAVLIWQYKNHAMLLTARVISPDHLVEANCTPGREDEDLYMLACDESVRTIKVAGPSSPPPPPWGWRKSLPTRRPRSTSADGRYRVSPRGCWQGSTGQSTVIEGRPFGRSLGRGARGGNLSRYE